MTKFSCLLSALFIVLSGTSSSFADIAAIHASLLPQEDGVLNSLKDAAELEAYSQAWTQNWKYPVPKEAVAARLGLDLASLNAAIKAHPDNNELLLLTGLVARYAYNVDVPGSFENSLAVLSAAEKLDMAGIRAPWFRATLRCQTNETKAGAEEFLAIEDSHPWEKLPPAFWTDYMECATVTNMPAHALRASKHLDALGAPPEGRSFLTDVNQKRFDTFDPKKDYAPKEVWEGANKGNETILTSTSCGLRLHVHGDWAINKLALTKGSCVANFSTGPYKKMGSKMRPSILVMAQQPTNGENLEEYSKRFQTMGSFAPYTPSHCPAERCIATKGTKPGGYGKDGDGHAMMLIFERNQPQFPGLAFEMPSQPPRAGKKDTGITYYRPGQTQERIPGKLYYVVLLDTAASIEEPALQDFDLFLRQLTVE